MRPVTGTESLVLTAIGSSGHHHPIKRNNGARWGPRSSGHPVIGKTKTRTHPATSAGSKPQKQLLESSQPNLKSNSKGPDFGEKSLPDQLPILPTIRTLARSQAAVFYRHLAS